MGDIPKPSFDFNNLIETAPSLLADHDIIEMVYGSVEARDAYAENFARKLVEKLTVDEQTKDRIFSTAIMMIGIEMRNAYDAVFHPHVEENDFSSISRVVLTQDNTEIRRNWMKVLEVTQDYAAKTALKATNRNASPNLRNG